MLRAQDSHSSSERRRKRESESETRDTDRSCKFHSRLLGGTFVRARTLGRFCIAAPPPRLFVRMPAYSFAVSLLDSKSSRSSTDGSSRTRQSDASLTVKSENKAVEKLRVETLRDLDKLQHKRERVRHTPSVDTFSVLLCARNHVHIVCVLPSNTTVPL